METSIQKEHSKTTEMQVCARGTVSLDNKFNCATSLNDPRATLGDR